MFMFKIVLHYLLALAIGLTSFSTYAQNQSSTPFMSVSGTVQATLSQVTPLQAQVVIPQVEWAENDAKTLGQYSPEKLNQSLKKLSTGQHFKNAFVHTYQNFPRESFLFFVAIGGVTAFQLATDYASDPVRMKNHVEHSISPVGMLSFFAFMHANNFTSSMLQTWMTNPRYQHFIPYLGMTAGFFVQTMISTFASDPNVKACVSSMLGKETKKEAGIAENPCEAAFSFYVIRKHLYNAAPSLISMLGSTVMAGFIQKGVVGAVWKATGVNIGLWFIPGAGFTIQTIRFLLMNTTQMAVFYYLDAGWLNAKVTYAFRNVFDGVLLNSTEQELFRMMNTQKKNLWQNMSSTCEDERKKVQQAKQRIENFIKGANDPKLRQQFARMGVSQDQAEQWYRQRQSEIAKAVAEDVSDKKNMPAAETACKPDFVSVLKKFNEDAAEWRMANLNDVFTAYQMWEEKLKNLNQQYITTYNFYMTLIGQLRVSKYNEGLISENLIDLQYPLMGVKPHKSFKMEKKSTLFTQPKTYEAFASDNLKEIAEEMKKNLDSSRYNGHVLYAHQIAALQKVQALFASEVPAEQGRGIQLLLKLRRETTLQPSSTYYGSILGSLHRQIGNAVPSFERGRGFLYAYEAFSKSGETLAATSFPVEVGAFKTPRKTDYLITQAVCGVNTNAVVKDDHGWPASFQPPRITRESQQATKYCQAVAGPRPLEPLKDAQMIYNVSLAPSDESELGQVSQGYLAYTKDQILPNILGDKNNSNAFQKWWEGYIESEMEKAYNEYASKYEDIVVRLVQGLWSNERSALNKGPLENGLVNSLRQQIRFGLVVLGEMQKDVYLSKHKVALPLEGNFSSVTEPQPIQQAYQQGFGVTNLLSKVGITESTQDFPLFRTLLLGGLNPSLEDGASKYTPIFDWNNLLRSSETANIQNKQVHARALQWQVTLNYEFELLLALIRKIQLQEVKKSTIYANKTQTTQSHYVIRSTVNNTKIQDQLQRIEEKLSELEELFSLEKENLPQLQAAAKNPQAAEKKENSYEFTADQKAVAREVLNGFKAAVQEVSQYAMMANAVSWEQKKSLSDEQNKSKNNWLSQIAKAAAAQQRRQVEVTGAGSGINLDE